MSDAILTIRNLRIAAGERVLARGWSLDLAPGERVALAGPSGSGKTTLLRAVAQLDPPAAGELRLDGRSPEDWGYPAWRRRVMLVAQRPALADAPVRENLARPFRFGHIDAAFDEEKARDLLSRVGLDGALERPARELSEGEQQRVCLARAVLLAPPVLLLDEPTSALDADAAGRAEALVNSACDAGAAALIVTHDPAQADRWCHRSVAIDAEAPAHAT